MLCSTSRAAYPHHRSEPRAAASPPKQSTRARAPVAALAGLAIPLILERVGIDPALAGSVILTTVTDVIGFFAFLGLATLVLLK